MRIVIDGRMYNESGIGRYIRNLITQLQIVDQENEYFILHLKDSYDTLAYRNNFHKFLADFRWYGVGEQIKLPGLLKSLKPDLVHFPHFNVPIRYRGKFVVTIHDLIHQHFSMERSTTHGPLVYKLKQLGYKKVFKVAIDESVAILVPSNFVRQQLIRDWKVDKGKITVSEEAVDDSIFTIESKMKKEISNKVMEKFNIKSPYIFYIGNAHPHKNVEGLIRAFGELRKKYPNLSLILSGNDHYFWQRVRKKFPQKDIIYTGYVSDEELVSIYKNAMCFVMPSLEEGFGIPLLEAMVCGCPVVSSNKGSLPEVGGPPAGGAVLYFDPLDINDMVEKIAQVLDDEGLRQKLVERGLSRYKEFNWEKLARKTLEVYQKCA